MPRLLRGAAGLLAGAMLAVVLAGCAARTAPPVERQLEAVGVIELQRTAETSGAIQAPYPAPDADAVAATSGGLTLEQAIATALRENPELRAMYAEFEAAWQKIPQMRSLPDPMVDFQYFIERPQTRTGEMIGMAGIMQELPWFGKLSLAGQLAGREALALREEFNAQLLDVAQQVAAAFHQLYFEREAYHLTLEEKEYLKQFLEAASAAYAPGIRGRQAVLTAQTELARVENELLGFPARIAGQEAALRRLLNLQDRQPLLPADSAAEFTAGFDPADLYQHALERRPELKRVEHQLEQSRLRRKLAQKDYWPDLNVGATYNLVGDRPDDESPEGEGMDDWGVKLGFNLPLRNARRRAQLAEAEKMEQAALQQRAALETRIRTELEAILSRLRSFNAQRSVFEDSLLPLAWEAFENSQAEYSTGNGAFLELLEAERTLLNVRRSYLEVIRDYSLTYAELERAVGGRLHPAP